jgi:hypothetical protein
MISDGGSNLLKSKQVQKVLNFYGIEDHITMPYHPASHGRIEISHASITTLLKMSSDSLNKPWFELCPFVQLALNCRPSTTLGGKTPMYFMFGTEHEYRRRKNFKLSDFPDPDELKEIWEMHDKACRLILREYNEIRNRLNVKVGGKMVNYEKGSFVWAKNFTKIPKMKMKTKYLTEPLEVVKDFGHAILAKNYAGIILKLHKDNVKRYTPENLELYNALPYKTKMRLGGKFNSKDLQNYFNEINKEETLPAITDKNLDQLPFDDFQVPQIIVTNENDDVNLDEEDDDDEAPPQLPSTRVDPNPLTPNQPEPQQPSSNPRIPDQPLHMSLRPRKVTFAN